MEKLKISFCVSFVNSHCKCKFLIGICWYLYMSYGSSTTVEWIISRFHFRFLNIFARFFRWPLFCAGTSILLACSPLKELRKTKVDTFIWRTIKLLGLWTLHFSNASKQSLFSFDVSENRRRLRERRDNLEWQLLLVLSLQIKTYKRVKNLQACEVSNALERTFLQHVSSMVAVLSHQAVTELLK